jgi:hypothetical protein
MSWVQPGIAPPCALPDIDRQRKHRQEKKRLEAEDKADKFSEQDPHEKPSF